MKISCRSAPSSGWLQREFLGSGPYKSTSAYSSVNNNSTGLSQKKTKVNNPLKLVLFSVKKYLLYDDYMAELVCLSVCVWEGGGGIYFFYLHDCTLTFGGVCIWWVYVCIHILILHVYIMHVHMSKCICFCNKWNDKLKERTSAYHGFRAISENFGGSKSLPTP